MSWSHRPALAALLCAATALTGYGATARAAPVAAPAAPASGTASVAALATDQGCTRLAAAGSTLAWVRYRPDDLAAMTLPKSSLGTAVRRYATDWADYGFMDNVELPRIQLGPKNQCALNRDFGRIVGFARGFVGAQTVWTADHLFFSAADAAGWVKAYVAGMKALPGSKGIASVRVGSLSSTLGPGAVKITASCANNCRLTHVLFLRGPVVGSVWDGRNAGAANAIDVVGVARKLSARMAARTALVNARVADPADAVMQLSAGLPKAALGSRYAGLTWDWLFGGCWDVAEAASQSASPVEATAYKAAAAHYGQLTYCRAMYAPARGLTLNRVERAFTGGILYTSATGATGALADIVSTWRQRAGRTVGGTTYGALSRPAVGALGNQTVALQQKAGSTTMTRIYVRHGRYVAVAALNARAFAGMAADVRRWAGLLDRRVSALLATRGF